MAAAESTTSVGRSAPRLRALSPARAALVVAALLPTVAYVVVAVQRIGYPYELTYFEGSTVEVTARVAEGAPLYVAPTTEWTPWPYPPLYFWLSGALANVTGVNLLTPRLVSFVASLAVLLLIALVVRRAGAGWSAALLASGLYAATYRVSGAWADTARVDSLLLALLLAAVLVGLRARSARDGLALGAILFLAFFTKQNALVVAAPMLLWLLVRRRRAGLAASVTVAVAVVGSTVVGGLLTDGWYVKYVVEQLPTQSWDLHWLWDFWIQDLLRPFAVCLVATAVLGWQWWRRGGRAALGGGRWVRRPGDQTAYLLMCLLGALLASWVARLHEGGFANVVMPAYAALAVGFGLLADAVLRSTVASRVAAGLAAVLLVQTVYMAFWQLDVVPTSADRAAGDQMVSALDRLPGRVLVPTHPYYLRMAGLPTHASSIAVYDLLHSSFGRAALGDQLPWSLDGVSAVVLDNTTDTQLFGDALKTQFTLVTTTFVPDGVFVPVTDLATHPSFLYVRTSALAAG